MYRPDKPPAETAAIGGLQGWDPGGSLRRDLATAYKLKKRVKELGMLFMPDSLYGTLWYATYVGLIATGSKAPAAIFPARWQIPPGL